MIHIPRSASVVCWVWLCLSSLVCNAQINQVSDNLIYTTLNPPPSGAQYNWTGFVNNNTGGGGTSGGNQPAYNSQTGTFIFGYTQGTVAYRMAVNNALANAGVGIKISGYNYSWEYYNQDYSRGTLTGNIGLTNSAGQVLQSYNYTMPKTTTGWTVMSGTQNFASEYQLANVGNLTLSFSGKDDRYWAGYYGPQIRAIDVRLNYSIDPCALNPASNPSCPGYKNIVESANIIPYPNNLNNTVAINTALKNSGSGMEIYGFNYGFSASANDYCAFQIIFCFDNRYPSASVNVNITNNNGSSIYSQNYTIRNSSGNFGYQYLFPQTQTLGSLGTFSFSSSKEDNAYVGNFYARALYTPDLCTRSPGTYPNCPGYVAPQVSSTSVSSNEQGSIIVSAPTTTTNTSQSTSSGNQTSVNETSPVSVSSSNTSQTSTQSTNTVSATTSVTPTATNPQPKVGEVVIAGSQTSAQQSSSSSGPSVGQVLNSLRNEQNRLSKLEMSVASAAVDQTNKEAAKTLNEAQAVASAQQEQTLSTAQNLISTQFSSDRSTPQVNNNATTNNQSVLGTGLMVMIQPIPIQTPSMNSPTTVVQSNQSSNISNQNSVNQYSITALPERSNQNTFVNTVQSSTQPITVSTAMPSVTFNIASNFRDEQENIKIDDQQNNMDSRNLQSPTNPLSSAMQPPQMPAQTPAPSGPVVNTKARDNDAAGSVTIAAVVAQPPGFELYGNSLRDAPFYPPREIYRNQRVVDNERVQRALNQRSDVLYNQIIDQQYRDNR